MNFQPRLTTSSRGRAATHDAALRCAGGRYGRPDQKGVSLVAPPGLRRITCTGSRDDLLLPMRPQLALLHVSPGSIMTTAQQNESRRRET